MDAPRSNGATRRLGPARPRPGTGSTRSTVDVALLIPLHGSAGMFGPSAELCAQLAAEEINAAGGVLGRELRLHAVDAAGPTAGVAKGVAKLVARRAVDAVVGWHLSSLRVALAPLIAGRVPYVYTALYEGGERTPGVFLTGEVPARQLAPAIDWMSDQYNTHRWVIVGNDYIWPRLTSIHFRRFATRRANEVVDELYVPLGSNDFSATLAKLEQARPDATLVLLVGEDAAAFNRAYSSRGLDTKAQRLSPLMDENMVLASGPDGTSGVHTTSGYFESLPTSAGLDFSSRYAKRFGVDAPMLNSLGQSCYEGIRLLDALVAEAGSLEVGKLCGVADGTTYTGARGELHLQDAHVDQPIYLGKAADLDIDVVAELSP